MRQTQQWQKKKAHQLFATSSSGLANPMAKRASRKAGGGSIQRSGVLRDGDVHTADEFKLRLRTTRFRLQSTIR